MIYLDKKLKIKATVGAHYHLNSANQIVLGKGKFWVKDCFAIANCDSNVHALEGSNIMALKGSKVVAKEGSFVEAAEDSDVKATPGSRVRFWDWNGFIDYQ